MLLGDGGSLEAPAVGTRPSPRAQLPSMRFLFVTINIAIRMTVMVVVITMMRFAVKMATKKDDIDIMNMMGMARANMIDDNIFEVINQQ